jgi:hypothetical protein
LCDEAVKDDTALADDTAVLPLWKSKTALAFDLAEIGVSLQADAASKPMQSTRSK